MIDNLIDEKYYNQVSNIVRNQDELSIFASNIYHFPSVGAEFWCENINDDLNPLSSFCILRPFTFKTNLCSLNVAYYIPMDIEYIPVKNPMIEFDPSSPKYNYIRFDTSLEEVLKQSRKIPACDVNSAKFHKFGSPNIIIDGVMYKRIKLSYMGIIDMIQNYDIWVESVSMLYVDEFLKLMNTVSSTDISGATFSNFRLGYTIHYKGEDNFEFI